MTKREVAKILDPYLPDQHAYNPPMGSLPFVLTIPSNAPNVTIPADALKPFQAREQAYGSALGLNPRGFATASTTVTTAGTTIPTAACCMTYSPCPLQDDAQTMYAQDLAGLETTSDTHADLL
jgi:hypothetical protein